MMFFNSDKCCILYIVRIDMITDNSKGDGI